MRMTPKKEVLRFLDLKPRKSVPRLLLLSPTFPLGLISNCIKFSISPFQTLRSSDWPFRLLSASFCFNGNATEQGAATIASVRVWSLTNSIPKFSKWNFRFQSWENWERKQIGYSDFPLEISLLILEFEQTNQGRAWRGLVTSSTI